MVNIKLIEINIQFNHKVEAVMVICLIYSLFTFTLIIDGEIYN